MLTPSLWREQGEAMAQSITLGQNTISNIAKSDPLIITGAIGTQNTYYHSSIGNGYRSPWANSFYANLNISLYGISMPFAFYYSNNNSSWSFPHISFHIDPTYKNWRAHFGRSTMALSSYIMNTSFNGVGLEYNSSKLRFGAFYGEGDTASYGLGRNSANMNTFWNPFRLNSKVFTGYECDPSKFLLPRAKLDGQYEGYTYLGLGVLIAVFAALPILFSCIERKGKKSKIYFLSVLYNKRIPLIACIAVFVLAMFMAISPVGTFDDKILYTIKYPDSIEKLLATFRASGRFAWVAQYMIYTGILYAFSKISLKKTSVAALAVCLGIQLADISPQIYSRRWYKEYQAHYNILKDARWEKLAKDCDKFYGLPYDQPEKYSYDFAQFAYEHNMTTNHFSVARPPLDDIIHQYYDVINDITNGTADPKALYVFFQPELIPQVEGLKIYEIDGLYVVKCPNQPDPLQ